MDLSQLYLVVFPPGELLDRLAILRIKSSKLGDEQPPELLYQLKVARRLWGEISSSLPEEQREKATKLYKELVELNQRQWSFEDKLREDKTAQAALDARQNNSLRVTVKNKVNEVFGLPKEIKIYKGE